MLSCTCLISTQPLSAWSMFLHPSVTSLSLCQASLAGKQKKNAAAIATESKGRPGPGCHLCSVLIGWAPPRELCCRVDGEGRQIRRALLWTQSHLSSPVKADLHRGLGAAVMTHLWLWKETSAASVHFSDTSKTWGSLSVDGDETTRETLIFLPKTSNSTFYAFSLLI